jgi:tetratricopeptide (TPR) repeat protein
VRRQALPLLCLTTWLGSAHGAPPPVSQAPTIGDLHGQSIPPVQRDAKPLTGGAAKAMENYRQFLQLQNADPKLRAEALRRLGDLNLESGELERMASEVTRIDAQGAEAIGLYSTLLKAYPNYPRNDQVLYQLARAYETTGQSALALSTLDLITARYPQSHDIAEVQFRRGELLFSDHRYAEAQHAYEAVLARGRTGSTFYLQSLYKHGWALFKQGQNEESLGSFGDLLDATLVDPKDSTRARSLDSLGRADRELVDDTLRVMSITFSYLDGSKSIDEFIAQRGARPYSYLLYMRLGDLLVEKQRYQDAATTYRAFVSRDPVDEHAPLLTNAAIEAYRKGGFTDLMLDGKLEYVQRYGFDAPFWNGRQHQDYPQVVTDLKANLKDVAEYYHAAAQKGKKPEDYAAAAHWYRVSLSSFPGEPESAATNYLLADALFESRQYADAAREYEHTAYDYPGNAHSAEAGYAALVAYQKQEDALTPDARSAVHQQATASAVRFAQAFPDHPQSAVVLTRAAQDLYAQGDQAQSAEIAKLLLARVPPVDAAKQRIGWTIVGQVSFNQRDFPAAEQAFEHALSVAAPNDAERPDITERLADSVYRQGESKRDAGDQAGAAADFLRVAQVAPSSKVVATAQYDAAAALITAQQWDQAIPVLEAYRRDYPKSDYAADVNRKLAVAYVGAGRSGPAAAEFERIAANPKEDPAVVHEALTQAASLYEKAGDSARAVPLLERLVKEYPTPVADAIEVRQRLLDMATKRGDIEQEHYWQREIIKADASAGPARTDRTRFLAAKAQLALAQPSRDAFRSVKLVAPLKQSLVAKKKALEAAVQAYKQVAEYGVAETTTAATYETAELYRTLAADLLQSERPKKLSADELEQYNSLLEEQAYPFEEQAISIHELNAKRAQEGTYDEPVRQSFAALAQLKPARYGKSELSTGMVAPMAQVGPPAVTAPSAQAQSDFQRALDLANAGKSTEAELEFRQFQLQYAGYAAPAIDLGLLARQQGKLDVAEADLRQATQLDGASAIAWSELGITLRDQGKFADARGAYEHAITADDSYAAAHRNLGVLLDLYVGDPAAALPEFERYKALTSEDKPVSTWIAELRTRTGIKAPSAEPATAPPAEVPGAPASGAADTSGSSAVQTPAAVSNNGGPT